MCGMWKGEAKHCRPVVCHLAPPRKRRIPEIILLLFSGLGLFNNLFFPVPNLSSVYWIIFLSLFSKVVSLFSGLHPVIGERTLAPLPHADFKSLGRRRRPEIFSRLLLSFRIWKTSLLIPFHSVYQPLCYLPSLNSFHGCVVPGQQRIGLQ